MSKKHAPRYVGGKLIDDRPIGGDSLTWLSGCKANTKKES